MITRGRACLDVHLRLHHIAPGPVQQEPDVQEIRREEILERGGRAATGSCDRAAGRDAVGIAVPGGIIESDRGPRLPAMLVEGIAKPGSRGPGVDA